MDFGTFVWVDDGDRPTHQLYDDHLHLAARADELGFAVYQMSEHHNTPLGLAPSPSVFLAAVARETTRIRLGPLVYLLPLYRTQRLVEEICMLDHLSHGRLELGIGRGVSPWELGHNGVDAAKSRELFVASLDDLLAGLRGDGSAFGDLGGAPLEMRPMQLPHPPLSVASTNPDTIAWAGRHGMNLMGLGPASAWAPLVELYHEEREAHLSDSGRMNDHVAQPRVGLSRQVLVAETDDEARTLAREVHPHFANSFVKLWEDNGDDFVRHRTDLEAAMDGLTMLVGSPASVSDMIRQTIDVTGINYITCSFAWGTLTREQADRSMELFATEVMPGF